MKENYTRYLFYFLISILVLICLRHIYFKKSPTIETLTDMSYYSYFNQLDKKFRKCGKTSMECRDYYLQQVVPFSNEEKRLIKQINIDYSKLLEGKFKKIFPSLEFLKVKQNIENGMPHTRGKYIVFSENIWTQLLIKYQKNPNFILDLSNLELIKLLAHEQFHIYQRFNPEKISNFYQSKWKLMKLTESLPTSILKLNRTNPDALPNENWLFPIHNNEYILPLCVYNSTESENINDTSNIYINVILENGRFIYPRLELDIKEKNLLRDLPEFTNFFGYQGANNYHAHEISASLFEVVVSNNINKNKHNENKTNSQIENKSAYKLLEDFVFQL